MKNIEYRAIEGLELRSEGDGLPTISGHAAVFGKRSEEMMGFAEIVKRGAFRRSLAEGADVRALVDHDPCRILGRNTAGTLSLREDRQGLKVSIEPPDTQVGRDTVTSIRRGDLSGMSFGFRTVTDSWRTVDGLQVRTLEDVDLFDVSVVTFPAYPDTSVAVRSMDDWTKACQDRIDAEAADRDRRLRILSLTAG